MTQVNKQEQFYVRKSYKTRKSTLLCIGNSKENTNLLFDQGPFYQNT